MKISIPEKLKSDVDILEAVFLETATADAEGNTSAFVSSNISLQHIAAVGFIDLHNNVFEKCAKIQYRIVYKDGKEQTTTFSSKEEALYVSEKFSDLSLIKIDYGTPSYNGELLQHNTSIEVEDNFNAIQFEQLAKIPCYIINLDKDSTRLKSSKTQLKKLGFTNINRWNAAQVQETPIHEQLKALDCSTTVHAFKSKQEMACTISHLTLLQDFLDSNDTHRIIFEDDIIFHSDCINQFNALNVSLDSCDVLFLGGWLWSYRDADAAIKEQSLDKLSFNLKSVEAHAYIINKRFAYEALKSFRLAETKYTIDMHYAYYMDNIKRGLLTHSPHTSFNVNKIKNGDNKRCGLIYQSNEYDSNIQLTQNKEKKSWWKKLMSVSNK